MSVDYFGDVLEDADKRMDFEVEEFNKHTDVKLMTLKLKSDPGHGVVSDWNL